MFETLIRRLHSGIPRHKMCEALKMPKVIPVNSAGASQNNGLSAVEAATDVLKAGGVIAVPTDTIYGVAALAQNSESVSKLYKLKNRNSGKPIAICVHDANEISRWAEVSIPENLLCQLLPGAVTAVFRRMPELNPALNPGVPLVGIRVPNSDFIRQVARQCGEPLALTSANLSSEMSTLNVQEFQALWPFLDAIFDGGNLGAASGIQREGSTVINFSVPGQFKIIREGCALQETKKLLQEFHLKEV